METEFSEHILSDSFSKFNSKFRIRNLQMLCYNFVHAILRKVDIRSSYEETDSFRICGVDATVHGTREGAYLSELISCFHYTRKFFPFPTKKGKETNRVSLPFYPTSAKLFPLFPAFCPDSSTGCRCSRRFFARRSSWTGRCCRS